MRKFISSFLFSFFVTLSMVMLDALFHLASATAVHVNYMAVKFTIIFLITFLTTHWVGAGWNPGVFLTVVGPLIFYIYYLFADATLNRDVFKLDDSFGYIFLHIACYAIAYATMYYLITQRKSTPQAQAAGHSLMFALAATGLDALYQTGKVQLLTKDDELVTAVLSFDTTLYLTLTLLVISFLAFSYIKNEKARTVVILASTVLFIAFIGRDIARTLVGIFAASIPYIILVYYSKTARAGLSIVK